MKRKLMILILCMGFFLVGCGNREKTIEEIASVSFDDISYILVDDNNYDVQEFTQYYRNTKYKKIHSNDLGNTNHMYFVCYDVNGNVLFTLVNVGNQDKYIIKKGIVDNNTEKTDYLYQLVK